MKKLMIGLLSTMLSVSVLPTTVAAEENENAESKNLKEKYYEILKTRKSVRKAKRTNEKEATEEYSEEFAILENIVDNPEAEIIEEAGKSVNNEVIIYDSANDIYVYANAIDDTNMELIVDGVEFDVVADKYEVNFISENGETLCAIQDQYETDEGENILEELSSDEFVSYEASNASARAASWVLAASNLKGTTTLYLQAVSVLGIVSSVTKWGCKYVGSGNIKSLTTWFTVLGIFATVGQNLNVTLYTIYDRYYRSDCTTYIRDYTRYYQYNNYTGSVGTAYNYFHSVNPSNAGQNCVVYA